MDDESSVLAVRREKLGELREEGQAFPNTFRRDHLAKAVHDEFDASDAETLLAKKYVVRMAGRVMLKRVMGKASFLTLQDMTGRIQVYVRGEDVSLEVYEHCKKWDLGDIVGVSGFLFKTKTGELSIHAETIELLTKSLRPLPEKFHGLSDQEQRYRQRYVDLMVNEESRQRFLMRSKILSAFRECLIARDFLEVETPMMHVIPGGAAARPFVTHHNALNMPLYLRIAPELYLKRLVVGGFEKVFEINRNFRNEGVSTRHNPEFTMMELYEAYADYHDFMNLTEALLREVTQAVLGTLQVTYQGKVYDLAKSFKRISVVDSILEKNPNFSKEDLWNEQKTREIAKQLGITVHAQDGLGKLQMAIFEETVEASLFEPTFIIDYPIEVSPLSRRSDRCEFTADRFEFFLGGRELANGFSELNDPEDQAERFHAQVKAKEAGDAEAMHFDADYITALEYGLPPTAGLGIGIDRFVMFLTDAPSIRDVILFPHMRHEAS